VRIFSYDFEKAPNGTSYITANTPYTSIGGNSVAPAVSDNTAGNHALGTYGAFINVTAESRFFRNAYAPPKDYLVSGVWYILRSALPVSPGNIPVLQHTVSGAAMTLRLNGADSKWQIRNVAAVVWSSNAIMAINTPYWVEFKTDGVNGKHQARIYNGATGALIEDSGLQTAAAGTISDIYTGVVTASTIQMAFDRHLVDDYAFPGWVKPAPPAANQAGMTKVDRTTQWLRSLGYSGSIQDMQYTFLYDQIGPQKPSLSSADMQIKLGRRVRDVLIPEDWPSD